MTIGQRIKTLREARNLSQDQLAERSAISQAQISRIESGQFRPVKALQRIALALGVTLSQLFEGVEGEE